MFFKGSRAGFVFLEQRVHLVDDRGEQSRNHSDHVLSAVSRVQGALEPNDCGARLQRAQNANGYELETVRRAHGQLQERETKVNYFSLVLCLSLNYF